MTPYVLSNAAEFDLDNICEYIAADKIDAADHWTDTQFEAFESLGRTPGVGHKRKDLTTRLPRP